jgi:hypothetical protein
MFSICSKRGPISLHNRLQILIRKRLNNPPIIVQHLNIASAIARTLLSVIKRK